MSGRQRRKRSSSQRDEVPLFKKSESEESLTARTKIGLKAQPSMRRLCNELATVEEWYVLGIQLGLRPDQLAEIELSHPTAGVGRWRSEMLSKWLCTVPNASWKDVVDALLGIKENTVANTIMAKYSIVQDKAAAADEMSRHEALAEKNLFTIQGKFGDLLLFVRTKLQNELKTEEQMQDFRLFLLTILKIKFESDVSNVQKIFEAITLKGLWNHLQYYLLEEIIKRFLRSDQEVIEQVEQYKKNLSGYKSATKLKDYMVGALKLADAPNSTHEGFFSVLSVKLDECVAEYTLAYLDELWSSLKTHLRLRPLSLLLREIRDGCICVTWTMPTDLVSEAIGRARQGGKFFDESPILRVNIDDEVVYDRSLDSKGRRLQLEPMSASLSTSETDDCDIQETDQQRGGHTFETQETGQQRRQYALSIQGIPGRDGRQNIPGPPGNQGPVGRRGQSGPPGPFGDDGLIGCVGPEGPQGAPGERGAVGKLGKKGLPGGSGIPGDLGPKGQQGASGLSGIPGPSGLDGSDGPKGQQGAVESSGAADPPAVKETDQQKTKEREYTLETQETDLQRTERSEYTPNIQDTNQSTSEDEGLDFSPLLPTPMSASLSTSETDDCDIQETDQQRGGHTFETQETGQQRRQYALSIQGIPGRDGRQSIPGPPGNQGPVGRRGQSGPPGPFGDDGLIGCVGPEGPQGAPGERGAVGKLGKKGLPGGSGIPGDLGPKSQQGASGLSGIPGPSGLDGSDGPKGQQGAVESSGAADPPAVKETDQQKTRRSEYTPNMQDTNQSTREDEDPTSFFPTPLAIASGFARGAAKLTKKAGKAVIAGSKIAGKAVITGTKRAGKAIIHYAQGETKTEVDAADPEARFKNACKAANECLLELRSDGFDLPNAEIATTFEHLQLDKDIVISTHGRHGCGKSTLLNALLNDSLLPVSLMNETAVKVKIIHDRSIHKSACPHSEPCENCPKVEVKYDNGEISTSKGQKEVKEAISHANKRPRQSGSQATGAEPNTQPKPVECTLTANVDILDQAPEGWQISLLDNPGFGESFQEKLMLETEMTMKTSSAYLYIMDAGQLSDKEDERCLDLIHRSDEGYG